MQFYAGCEVKGGQVIKPSFSTKVQSLWILWSSTLDENE